MTSEEPTTGTTPVKRGMAEMLKGGVIMDVVTPDQAKIAEDAGAVAVMALERVPADIRAQGGVARMSDPDLIDGIVSAVSIPVMAKARIGHFAEAQVLQSLGVETRWLNAGGDLEIIPPAELDLSRIDEEAARRTRSVIMFLGPLLHRATEFQLPYAGGCDLGTRTVEPHLTALRPFGLLAPAYWLLL